MIKAHATISAFWFKHIIHTYIVTVYILENFLYCWIIPILAEAFGDVTG
jgi:hypothetical protein